MQKNRCKEIDVLKGIAILMVVLGHIIEGVIQSQAASSTLYDNLNFIYIAIYSFHMPMFFCISGYIAAMNKKTFKYKVLVNNMLSLYVPYIIFSYIFIILRFFVVHNTEGLVYSDIYTALIKPVSIFWFLMALLIMRTVSDVLHYFIKREWCVLIISIVIFLLGISFNITSFFSLDRVVQFYVCYEFGFIYCGMENKAKRQKYLPCACLICVFSMILFEMIDIYISKILIGISVFVILFEGLKLLFELIKRDDIFDKNICVLGKNTMVIYLVHPFLTGPVRQILSIFIQNVVVIVAVEFFILVLIPMIVIFMYNKISFFKWIEYVFYPNKVHLRYKGKNMIR